MRTFTLHRPFGRTSLLNVAVALLMAVTCLCPSAAQAANGTWLGTEDAMWTNSNNWSASPYAGQQTGETATFDNAGNNNTNLNISGLYNIGTFIFTGASVAAYTIGSGAPNSQTLVMGSYDSTYRLDSTCANSQTFNCQIQLGGGDYNSSGIFRNDTASQLLTLNKLFAPNSSPNTKKTVTIKGTGPVSILGDLVPAGCILDLVDEATGDLTLSGNADLRTFSLKGGACALTGANGAVAALTCTVSSSSSLLLINTAAANRTDRLDDATRVFLSGGTLRLGNDAGDADFSESVGEINLVSGDSTIAVDQAADTHAAILHIASLSRLNSGATVNFTGNGLGESDRCRIFIAGQDDGLIGSWAIVNGTYPAYYYSAVGVCTNASAQEWAVTNIAARAGVPNAVVPDDASADVRITEQGVDGAVTLAGDPVNRVGILRQYTDVSSVIATADKTLRAYTVGIAAGAASLTIGESAGDGTLTPLTAGGILILDNASGSALTVNAALADNSSTSGLQKSGDGSLVIAGPTLYTGPTLINGGSLTFDGAAGPQSISANMSMNGHSVTKTGSSPLSLSAAVTAGSDAASIDVQEGTLSLEGGAQLNGSAANTNYLRSGTTLNFSNLVSRPVWSLVCEDNTRYNVSKGALDTQNNWAGPVTLNGGTLYLTGDTSVRGGISGEISGSGSLCLTNASASVNPYFLITGTNNTYAGPTRGIGGWLYVNSIRNVGEPSSLGQPMNAADGTIHLGDLATPGRIVYRGTGDVTDRVIDMAGTTGWTTLGMEGTGPLVYSNLTVSTAGSKILYLVGNSSSTAELVAPVVNGSSGNVSVDKQNSSTWILSGDCTYGGTTLVEDGTLVYKGNSTLPGTITVRKGLLTVEGTLLQPSSQCLLEGSSTSNALLRLKEGASMTNNNLMTVRANGAVYIEGGTLTRASNINTGIGEYFAFGWADGGYGYLKMSGGTVTSPRIMVASVAQATPNGSIGIARLSGGTATFSSNPHVGAASNSIGVLTIDNGGTFLKTGSGVNTYLGYYGGRGELNLTGGYLNNNKQVLIIGQNASYPTATGIVNLCAGSLANTTLERWSGKFLLNFCGGTLAAGASSPASMISGADGVYSFGPVGEFSGGACFDTAGRDDLYLGASIPILAPTGQGVQAIALSNAGSGYVGEPYVAIRGGGGDGATAVANMVDDGKGKGTFKVASVTITCPGMGYTSAPTVTFLKGGALAVAATGSATLAANSSGGLTKLGAGTLTIRAANTYSGATTVSEGTLLCETAVSLPKGTDIILAGGTLDLGGFTRTNGTVTGTSGTLANGTLALTGDILPGGQGTIGTLTLGLASCGLTGGNLVIDVAADGSSDCLAIQGDINLAGLSLQIANPEALDPTKAYTILTCSGTRTGAFSSVTGIPDSRWHSTYRTDGSVLLIFTDGTLIRIH